jgi:hypothetical protein
VNPGQDDPDAADLLDLDPGLEDGTSPGSSSGRTPAGGHARGMPGYAAAESAATTQAARARWDAAARSVRLPYSGITLSDEGVRENARGPAVRCGFPSDRGTSQRGPGRVVLCSRYELFALGRGSGMIPAGRADMPGPARIGDEIPVLAPESPPASGLTARARPEAGPGIYVVVLRIST